MLENPFIRVKGWGWRIKKARGKNKKDRTNTRSVLLHSGQRIIQLPALPVLPLALPPLRPLLLQELLPQASLRTVLRFRLQAT